MRTTSQIRVTRLLQEQPQLAEHLLTALPSMCCSMTLMYRTPQVRAPDVEALGCPPRHSLRCGVISREGGSASKSTESGAAGALGGPWAHCERKAASHEMDTPREARQARGDGGESADTKVHSGSSMPPNVWAARAAAHRNNLERRSQGGAHWCCRTPICAGSRDITLQESRWRMRCGRTRTTVAIASTVCTARHDRVENSVGSCGWTTFPSL